VRRRLIGLAVVLIISWGGVAAVFGLGIRPKLGLDLQGGTSVVLTAPPDTPEDVLVLAVERMRARIEDVGGVQEPEIAISGAGTVLVQLPGVEDEERALAVIGQTGLLSFRPVLDATPGDIGPLVTTTTTTTTTLPTSTTTAPDTSTTTVATTTSTTAPATTPSTNTEPATTTTTTLPPNIDPVSGLTILDDPSTDAYLAGDVTFPGASIPAVLHVGPAQLAGSDVADAIPLFDPQQAVWVVSLDLTSQGADLFAQITAEAARYPVEDPRRRIAIVLDGEIVTAPQVAQDVGPEGITGGRAVITFGTGPTDEQEARDTAVVLRYGALPVAFERSQVQKVSATLGADSLRSGVIAGLLGLGLVAALLIGYYRSLGLAAILGLTVFGSLLVSIFALLGRYQGLTLTLAGVTGVIVAIGITADSYIVYFERIKEEIRRGRTVRSSVEEAFKAAYRTILTADTVSLLAAGLLWFLAVGPVKGFALSLGIATILDVIVARAFTRRAAWLLAHTPLAEGGWFTIAGAAL
jgi:protein-export membrane protein SecD